MTRRQSECFRNLDDPLKVFSLLTVKSCGLVLLFYASTVLLELLFGLFTLLLRRLEPSSRRSARRSCWRPSWRTPSARTTSTLFPRRSGTTPLAGGGPLQRSARDRYQGNALEEFVEGGPWRP